MLFALLYLVRRPFGLAGGSGSEDLSRDVEILTGITFVTPEKRAEVDKIARVLELRREFGDAGLRMDAPRSPQHPSGNRSRRRRPR